MIIENEKSGNEKIPYYLILLLLIISSSGMIFLRYALYTAPVWLFFVWLLIKGPKISYNKDLTPFYFLLFFALATSISHGFYSFKQSYFLFVYVFSFTIFDFSRIKINEFFLVLILFFLVLMQVINSGAFGRAIHYSFMDSQSSWESTFSFCFGMLAVYFLLTKKYFYFLLA
ncbi:hypothetical protein ThidrDRAFT_4631 [Thiorhodococcus drewsii AZ1]|uniref:O-antigen polymerase n=1 Tax=Thiorhodococcus drewsii AZ1 TaxID=765913 RepID=G2E8L7_9GAMM|nr:hypothetical protein ThidrDRAFT_4631 [Thiorhodococcus drewsii AZ1]